MSDSAKKRTGTSGAPRFIAVDFFCGAGGTTRGLIDAGGYVVAGIDKESHCRETYERNNVNTTLDGAAARYVQMDIFNRAKDYPQGQGQELSKLLAVELDRVQQQQPGLPLLFSICAPCQPFSQINGSLNEERKNGRTRDRGLLDQTAKFVKEFMPQLILCENVAGIQKDSYGGVWQKFMKSLRKLGYVVGSNIVESSKFGIPQRRERSIMLAIHKSVCNPDHIADLGLKTEHFKVPLADYRASVMTVEEAIGHFPPISAGETYKGGDLANHQAANLKPINLKRIRLVSPGGSNLVFGAHGVELDCHKKLRAKPRQGGAFNDIYTRMAPDKPSPTITTKCQSISNGRFGHYKQDRGISTREAAALQTFPDDYVFYGSGHVANSRMIGNAVPPKLSRFFANTLVGALNPANEPYYTP